MNPSLLVSISRGVYSEIQIRGEVCVTDGIKSVFHSSEIKCRFPSRSLLKPFQFMATGLAHEKMTSPLYLAALGSISATEQQVKKLEECVGAEGLSSEMESLKLSSFPLDENYRVTLKNQGKGPSQICHMCFSKHLSILKACKKKGWRDKGYLTKSHPFHTSLSGILKTLLNNEDMSLDWVEDGCHLPTPVFGLDEIGALFQVLAQGTLLPELKWIRDAMMEFPDWIGGPDRIDSLLMKSNSGKLIAKEGADGLLALGLLPTERHPRGLGILLKLAGGYAPHQALHALKPVLDSLNINYQLPAHPGQEVKYHYRFGESLQKEMFDISPVVSPSLAVWPGDEPFSLQFSQHVNQGNHLTLSKIQTTVHLGSHTDSPIHFGENENGMEAVDLRRYLGSCQVVQISKDPHSQINSQDLKGIEIIAPRILFKTGSYPDPTRFNTDFNSLSADLICYLASKGVVLVGIDTPSIDLFESKDLPAHHATLKTRMAILEGINLNQVLEGIYDLIALPLKIEGADASPVRAILTRG